MTPPNAQRPSLLFTALLACLVVAVALACKKKKEELSPELAAKAAQLKPQAVQRLAQFASLAPKAKAEASTYSDQPPAQKLAYATYAVIGEEQLVDPHADPEVDVDDARVSLCKYAVESTALKEDDVKKLEDCARFEFAAVVRQKSFKRPEVTSSSTYSPGEFSGDVLVMHLATGEVRGRYALSVSSDSKLEMKGQRPNHEWERLAKDMLEDKIKTTVSQKLTTGGSAQAPSTEGGW